MTARGIISTFKVGKRFRCTMSADTDSPGHVTCRWSPDMPRKLKQRDIEDYRRGRDAFYAELGKATGRRIAVVELEAKGPRVTVPNVEACDGRA